jgi:hypothetical protein
MRVKDIRHTTYDKHIPSNSAAKAVAHNGSVVKITPASAAGTLSITAVSPHSTAAVVTRPIHKMLPPINGLDVSSCTVSFAIVRG